MRFKNWQNKVIFNHCFDNFITYSKRIFWNFGLSIKDDKYRKSLTKNSNQVL